MIPRKNLLHLLSISTISLIAGLSFGLFFYHSFPDSCVDVDGFGELGATFARSYGFQGSIRRGPIYPFILGLTYLSFGIHNHYAVIAVQSAFLVILGTSLYYISLRLFHSPRLALWTAVVTLLHPVVWWYVPRLWVELIFAVFVVWMFYAAFLTAEKPTLGHLVLFGFLSGLTALCKSIVLLFPPFLAMGISVFMIIKLKPFEHISRKDLIRLFFIPAIIMLATVFPWTLRNRIISGKWLLVSSNVGVEFFRGNVYAEQNSFLLYKTIPEIWNISAEREEAILSKHGFVWEEKPDYAQIDAIFNPLMMKYITRQPLAFAIKIIKQLPAFWIRGETLSKSVVFIVGALLTLGLCIGGSVLFKDRVFVYVVFLCIVYFNLIYAAILAWSRYSMPLYPIMMLPGIPFIFHITGKN